MLREYFAGKNSWASNVVPKRYTHLHWPQLLIFHLICNKFLYIFPLSISLSSFSAKPHFSVSKSTMNACHWLQWMNDIWQKLTTTWSQFPVLTRIFSGLIFLKCGIRVQHEMRCSFLFYSFVLSISFEICIFIFCTFRMK